MAMSRETYAGAATAAVVQGYGVFGGAPLARSWQRAPDSRRPAFHSLAATPVLVGDSGGAAEVEPAIEPAGRSAGFFAKVRRLGEKFGYE
jgi:hypothetical protein